jgi:flagellar biosynthetic protein FliQ
MSGAEALDIGRDALWLTLIMAGPVMLVGLVVGVAVSVLQALTQVQEQTLVFVPKIIAIFLALLLFLPVMGALMGGFATDTFARVAAY